jgi:hypothetical protein
VLAVKKIFDTFIIPFAIIGFYIAILKILIPLQEKKLNIPIILIISLEFISNTLIAINRYSEIDMLTVSIIPIIATYITFLIWSINLLRYKKQNLAPMKKYAISSLIAITVIYIFSVATLFLFSQELIITIAEISHNFYSLPYLFGLAMFIKFLKSKSIRQTI